jgi:hypothetical protein
MLVMLVMEARHEPHRSVRSVRPPHPAQPSPPRRGGPNDRLRMDLPRPPEVPETAARIRQGKVYVMRHYHVCGDEAPGADCSGGCFSGAAA